ncbi:proteasome inhibitor PI31 subunit-like isoform X2 [Arctopsyche grandis]|uniref:proteasome inhibitor PI31 subunit-like isoform X2 n=1 Tax=Arctopsyche grandis TaxID=121162 RepID=UPI00406D9CD0
MVEIFGWELLYDGIKDEITKKCEILLVFVHWILISNGAKCLGCNNILELKNSEKKSGRETLPDGWNHKKDKYTLRYVINNRLFILYGVDCDEIFLLNWLNVSRKVTANVVINIESTVKSLSGPLDVILPDYQEEIYNLNKNLFGVIYESKTKCKEIQTQRAVVPVAAGEHLHWELSNFKK